MKSGNTVILPLREKRINPLTGHEEIAETGMVAEFSMGKQVSAPFAMPSYTPEEWAQHEQARRAGLLQEREYGIASFQSQGAAVQDHARPGESPQQTAARLGEAAARFEVSGNRATAAVSANGQRYFGGSQ